MERSSRILQCLLLCLWVFPELVFGASSSNYNIGFNVLNSGGGATGSLNYQMRASSIHSMALGKSASTNHIINGGVIPSFFPRLVPNASSANFRINIAALNSGGGATGSLNYQMHASSIHAQALGESISTNYHIKGGMIARPDFDGDGIVDGSDNCPLVVNVTQTDTDYDGLGDVCDPYINNVDGDGDGLVDGADGVVLVTTFSGIDANGDGYADGEQDVGTLATNFDTDNDGFSDGEEVYFNSNPLLDLDTPANGDVNLDGIVNVVDVLLVTRHILGPPLLDEDQMVRSDVAPVNTIGIPTPDGIINVGDLLRIQQMALQPTVQ